MMRFFKKVFGKKEIKKTKTIDEKPTGLDKVKEINVDDLKEKMDNEEDFILVDIRTEPELQFGKIKYKQLFIPMQELPSRLNELHKDKQIILYCRIGNRTYEAAGYLVQQGFKNVASLEGGIIAWKKFDNSIIPY